MRDGKPFFSHLTAADKNTIPIIPKKSWVLCITPFPDHFYCNSTKQIKQGVIDKDNATDNNHSIDTEFEIQRAKISI